MQEKITDAEFEVLDGPMRPGDEHPTRKGWFLTERLDRRGNPLWYKPPARYWRWLRPALLVVWLAFILVGLIATQFE